MKISGKLAALLLGVGLCTATPVLAQRAPIGATETRALDWLVRGQREDGGWGFTAKGGTSDPGMTAYVGLALIRAGIDHTDDRYRAAIQRATPYLLSQVKAAPSDGPLIGATVTDDTQLHYKMGKYVDAALCAQYFARLLPHVSDADQLKEIRAAAAKCLWKLQEAQDEDGGWNKGGWATILQTGIASQTLEVANIAGLEVNAETERRARQLLRSGASAPTWPGNSPGETKTGKTNRKQPKQPAVPALNDAGVQLYANAARQRACARDVRAARRAVPKGTVTLNKLHAAGILGDRAIEILASVEVYGQVAKKVMAWGKKGAAFLKGFGNCGGEEVISYLMISESMVGAEDPEFPHWRTRVSSLLKSSQNKDGSWVGHHCLTSPTVVTSASVLCLTADREPQVFHDQLAAVRAVPGETQDWERVHIPSYGAVSIKRVVSALANAPSKREVTELLGVAKQSLGELSPSARFRVAILLTKLTSRHQEVTDWADATARELTNVAEGQDVAAALVRARDLSLAGANGDPGVIALLIKALQEPTAGQQFKRMCMDLLVQLQGAEAAPVVVEELESEDLEQRQYAWNALETLVGARRPFDPLASPLKRRKAIKAWKAWSSSDDGAHCIEAREASALRQAVRELRVPSSTTAAAAILRSRGETSLPLLVDCMARADSREPAHALLRELTGRDLPATWEAWSQPIPRPRAGPKAHEAPAKR